jgi:hypothetical protein
MKALPNPQQPLVFSYLELRQAVGFIGISLPFVLSLGKLAIGSPGLQPTISHYYYTNMGNYFVGSMCAIGVFLLATPGYDVWDRIAGNLAFIFAVGVGLFPTAPCFCSDSTSRKIGDVHLACATLLFLTLAYFSLFLFTKTDPTKDPTPQKLRRNVVYRICGWLILASIASVAFLKLRDVNICLAHHEPVFLLESLAVCSFGFSWLVKGETILKDK